MQNHSEKKDSGVKKKISNAKNFGEGMQVYDVVFEVDKLDSFARFDGKTSEKYKSQHEKTVRLITRFNNEMKGSNSLSLSKSREIIQSPRLNEGSVFYNDGKGVAGNKGEV